MGAPRYRMMGTDVVVEAYQVPAWDEDPPEDMPEWLADCVQDWDGDPGGVTIDGVLAAPGDYVVRSPRKKHRLSRPYYWCSPRHRFKRMYRPEER